MCWAHSPWTLTIRCQRDSHGEGTLRVKENKAPSTGSSFEERGSGCVELEIKAHNSSKTDHKSSLNLIPFTHLQKGKLFAKKNTNTNTYTSKY